MKRRTARKGAPKTRQEAFTVWQAAWQELPQEKIQQWIERIPWYVKQIIELEGGTNTRREGRRSSKIASKVIGKICKVVGY